jgi:hypothetical protein
VLFHTVTTSHYQYFTGFAKYKGCLLSSNICRKIAIFYIRLGFNHLFRGGKEIIFYNLALYIIFILDKASERLEEFNISEGFRPLWMYVPRNISAVISTLKSKSHTFDQRLVLIFQQTTIGSLSSPNCEHNTAKP